MSFGRPLPPPLTPWRTCPVCGIALEQRQAEPDAQPHLQCPACDRAFYANPNVTATVCAERADGALLLVRRAIDPFRGCWDLPGGFLEHGEDPADAALRELLEETGLRARLTGIVGIWPDTYGSDAEAASTVNVFYSAVVDDLAGAGAASDVDELRWFAPRELPPRDELAFDCVPRAVDAWLAQC